MWEVVTNGHSNHIYIKEKFPDDSIRAIAMIPTGMINNTKQAMEDAEMMAKAPEMAQLLAEIRGEGYLSYSLEKRINDLLGDADGN